ncbi:MAG: RHS repeat-associated core domain-containing protein, partial [Lentisphaeria bacterium]|nr:RHS repeat-associated core domain-containing protein [Lentisphaeria bacterium]
TYYYDGDGRRVKKVVGTKTTVYVYDASGQLAAEYTNEADGNQPACTTCFLTADHLGSTRLITDETGATAARYDYYPFGWEINRGTTDWSNPKFTGQLRDYESGLNLDHFGARYFASAMGRFASADPLMASAHIGDPQSWNRYTYGLNNPLRFTDPLGLYVWDSTLGGTAADSPRNRSPVLPFRSPLAQKPRSDRFGRDNGDRFQRRTLIAFPGESLIGFGRIRRMPPIEPVFIPRCAAPVWGRRRDSQAIRVR